MFKKNLAMGIMGLFTPVFASPAIPDGISGVDLPKDKIKHGKGQLRDTKPKPSGAAQLKRASTKRKNKQR